MRNPKIIIFHRNRPTTGPSSNLYSLVYSKHAADSILRDGKVGVCPAFERSAN